ncbi:hypothetical protein FOMPIDRAFT_1137162 [Fomitopsis schrenkii]|uniref:Uncharacterized protein n=1 Tax=Fomitopsis schrenkii TaxID=2126942 RepID=S8F1J7_FOMSC|nr:hypothetical protein FOMPIDRAFT_1137162 [Fomitopsis schrenkii]
MPQGDNPPKIKTPSDALHFGIPGAARIARNVKVKPAQRCDQAIAERSQACADTFAERWSIPSAYDGRQRIESCGSNVRRYASVRRLSSSLYCEWTMKGLVDSNVPCKKPVAVNAANAHEMFGYAAEQNLVLLEV